MFMSSFNIVSQGVTSLASDNDGVTDIFMFPVMNAITDLSWWTSVRLSAVTLHMDILCLLGCVLLLLILSAYAFGLALAPLSRVGISLITNADI